MHFLTATLRRQLIAAFSAVVVVMLVALLIGYTGVSSVNNKVRAASGEQSVLEAATGHARDMVASQFATILDPHQAANHAGDVTTFELTINTLQTYAKDATTRRAVAGLRTDFAHWQQLNNRVVSLATHNQAKAAAALANGAANTAADLLTTDVQAVSAAISSANTSAAANTASSSQVLMLIIALIAGLIAAAITFLLSRDLSRRTKRVLAGITSLDENCIADLGSGLEAMANGDLRVAVTPVTKPIEDGRPDEIGQLTATFNRMLQKTQASVESYNITRGRVAEMLGQISRTSEQVAAASQEMASTSEEAGRAVGEIAQAITSVSEGAEDQVRSLSEAKQLTDEVAAAAQASAHSAQQTAEAAANARALADEGAEAVTQATEAMHAVRSSSAEVTEAIRDLEQKSDRIGEIVGTITGIAGQTNLLALNAAIEAARVGEQGRGFAVVAEEVRKLAEESQAAASSIAELIEDIQHGTRRAVEVVEAGARQTEDGAATVDQAREAFTRISEAVSDMSGRVEQITGTIAEIATAGARMQDNMTSVASVAEESSASTEEVSASTEQTSASTQQIAASAHDLARTADELERLVGQFALS